MRLTHTIGFLVGALLLHAAKPAGAVDCNSSTIDETICASKLLVSREQALAEEYHAALKRLDQRNHDSLIDGQFQWRKDVAARCANVASINDQRADCISRMIDARRQAISTQLSQAATTPSAGKSFEGHWESCETWQGIKVCSFFTLFQKGDRICGNWRYWANSEYDGRLVWTVDSKAADRRYICGQPGSDTSLNCPTSTEQALWQKTSGTSYICSDTNGRYIIDLEKRCRDEIGSWSKRWHSLTAKQLLQPANEKWLRQCLGGADYPDPSIVQDTKR